MRHRKTIHTTVSALVLLGVAVGASPPAAAAPAAGPPAVSTDSTIGVAIEVRADGNGPFSPTDEPGGDTGASNGIVRTMDAVTYRVTVSSNDGSSSNERFTVTAPSGTSWAGLPGDCTDAGSSIVGADLTCNTGTVAEGKALFVPVVLNVSGDLANGDTFAVPVTATADDAGNGPVTATSASTTVSAAARYNLSKDVHASRLVPDAPGPDGSTGLQLTYPIAVDWQPLVPGQGLLGFEKSAGPMTFTDDLSRILGDLPSGAVLWNGGDPVCGPNGDDAWTMPNLPRGSGGGATGVVDSGTIACTQSGPGADVDVTITGTVTDPEHFPTKAIQHGPIAGGVKPYVVSGFISVWLPTPPDGTTVNSVNVFTPLRTTSVSGAQNYPGSSEPLADNRAERTITEYAAGTVSKQLFRVTDDRGTVSTGSAKDGDPWYTAGDRVRSEVALANPGLSSHDDVIICDTWDRRTQRLTQVGGRYGWESKLTGGVVRQYAASTMSSPAEGQRQADCGDDAGPWYDDPDDVPGGIDAIGATRSLGDVRGGDVAVMFTFLELLSAENGTRAYDFGHAWMGDRDPRWVHDTWSDAELGAGPLSDSALITENRVRVEKKVVDPGHDPGDTPDDTSFAVAGNTVDFALYPTLTNGNTTGGETTVTVRDVLPSTMHYVPGSASPAPVVDTTVDGDGKDVQRLTWDVVTRPNALIEPIRYSAVIAPTAPAGSVTNTVVVASPTDASPEAFRAAERALQIVVSGGVVVEKAAVEPVVVAGDHPRWTLSYTNTDASPIDELDVIDVLPHPGDSGNSSFHGTVGLAEPVAVDPAAGERVLYTEAAPETIALDPQEASNQPGGSTRWCTASTLATDGCPDDLAHVTAFRLERRAPVASGGTVTHQVALATDGQQDGDVYTNRFGLRASNLALPVQSNPASVRVVAGSIGDRVWQDTDGDGLQDHDEPGVGDVPVALTGTDDRGQQVTRTTASDADGTYTFDGLRPGTYRVRWTSPDGQTFTVEHAGDDRAVDSDADADGRSPVVTVGRVETESGGLTGVDHDDTVDAGLRADPTTPVLPPVGPDEPGESGAPGGDGSGSSGGTGSGSGSGGSVGRTDSRPGGGSTIPGTGAGQHETATGHRELAFTGATGLGLVGGLAVLLLLAGGGVVAVRRRQGR